MDHAIQLPTLAEGERYLGAFGDTAGNIHHTILLPGDNDDASWQSQIDWAKSIGGELPTRAELVTAYETMPEEFKKDWYWSNAEHVAYPDYAWVQYFTSGSQYYYRKNDNYRARAVRRLPI
jgi:hypothetical protein